MLDRLKKLKPLPDTTSIDDKKHNEHSDNNEVHKKTEEANSIIHTLSVVSTLINASMFMSNKNNIIIRFWLFIFIFLIQRLHIKYTHIIINM